MTGMYYLFFCFNLFKSLKRDYFDFCFGPDLPIIGGGIIEMGFLKDLVLCLVFEGFLI